MTHTQPSAPRTPETVRPPVWVRPAQTILGGLGRLPARVQRLLGGKPVRIDGQELHPEIQFIMRMLNAVPGTDFATLPVAEARAVIDLEASLFGGKLPPSDIDNITIPTDDGSINARLYRPPGTRPAGLVVYFHGGGWVLGSLDSHDAICAFLAHEADVTVMAVDYRLAPEHPFPAGVNDAIAAFRHCVANADELGIDPTAIAVAGDSAGGNLSAVVAQATTATGEQGPALQVLVVPVTDLSTKHTSYQLFSDGFFLTEAHMDWYKDHYLTDPSQALDPRVSPLLADDLTGLPPAYVAIAGFDPLRDEGIAYARRLKQAGVTTVLRVHTGLIHPFIGVLGAGKTGRAADLEIAAAIRFGLAHATSNKRYG